MGHAWNDVCGAQKNTDCGFLEKEFFWENSFFKDLIFDNPK